LAGSQNLIVRKEEPEASEASRAKSEGAQDRGARTRAGFEFADRLGLRSDDGPLSREEANERYSG